MTVLIAFDGSADSRSAVEYAARHLKPEPTVILTIWEPQVTYLPRAPISAPGPALMRSGDHPHEEEERAKRLATEGGELAAERGIRNVTARARRAGGPVWQAIVEVADELDATLIVTGSRRVSTTTAAVMGSVSTRVLHHAHRPTLVVAPRRAEEKPPLREKHPLRGRHPLRDKHPLRGRLPRRTGGDRGADRESDG